MLPLLGPHAGAAPALAIKVCSLAPSPFCTPTLPAHPTPHPTQPNPTPAPPGVHALQEEFSEELVLPLAEMPHEGAGQTYVVLARPPGSMALGRFVNILRFRVKEIDPSTGERPSPLRPCHTPAPCSLPRAPRLPPLLAWRLLCRRPGVSRRMRAAHLFLASP